MLITSIALDNFKSYVQERITFQPGVNAIIGANGAGKSTILEAIGFCLFGCRGAGYERRVREGSNHGQVTVGFTSSFDERGYEVERVFNQTATTRYRVIDPGINQVIAEGSENVQLWLTRHLKIEPGADLANLFENTIGIPQGTFTAPFLLTAAQRKTVFDPLLQVEEYQRGAEKLLATNRMLTRQSSELQSEAARLEGMLAELPGLQDEALNLKRDIASAKAYISSGEIAVRALDTGIKQMDAAEAAIRANEASSHTAQLRYAQAHQQLAAAQASAAEADEARIACLETQADHQQYVRCEEQYLVLSGQRTKRDALREDLNRQSQERTRITTRQQGLSQEIAQIAGAAERVQAIEPGVKEQGRLEALLAEKLAACKELAFSQRQAEEARQEYELAAEREQQIARQLQHAGSLDREVSDNQLAQQADDKTMAALTQALAACQNDLARLEQHTRILENETTAHCPVCGLELTAEHRTSLLAENHAEMAALASKKNELQQDQQALSLAQQQREKALKSLQAELRKLPSEPDYQQAQEAVQQRSQKLATLREQVKQLDAAPRERDLVQAQLTALGDPRAEYQLLSEQVKRGPALLAAREQLDHEGVKVTSTCARLEEELAQYRDLDADMLRNQESRDRLRSAHMRYLANQKSAAEYETRQQRVETLGTAEHKAEGEMQAQEAALQAARAAYPAEAHQKARADWQTEQTNLAAARTRFKIQAERLNAVERKMAELDACQDQLKSKQASLAESVQAREMLEQIRGWLREAGPQVTRRLVARISQEGSAIFCDIMDDHSGWLQWDSSYELELEIRGNKRAFRQLSGGEQMIAALALRLALLRHTSAVDIAFFDEPTAHLDPERRENLAEKMTQVKGFRQVFVISHDDTFERDAYNYIRIVKDENGSRWERRAGA